MLSFSPYTIFDNSLVAAVSPDAIANSLDRYCLSQVGQRPKFESNLRIDEPPSVTFEVEGELFRVVAAGSQLRLIQDKEKTPLANVKAIQYEYGRSIV